MSSRNPRYDHKKPSDQVFESDTPLTQHNLKTKESLEIIEDCAEDLEDEIIVPSQAIHGSVTPLEIGEP